MNRAQNHATPLSAEWGRYRSGFRRSLITCVCSLSLRRTGAHTPFFRRFPLLRRCTTPAAYSVPSTPRSPSNGPVVGRPVHRPFPVQPLRWLLGSSDEPTRGLAWWSATETSDLRSAPDPSLFVVSLYRDGSGWLGVRSVSLLHLYCTARTGSGPRDVCPSILRTFSPLGIGEIEPAHRHRIF